MIRGGGLLEGGVGMNNQAMLRSLGPPPAEHRVLDSGGVVASLVSAVPRPREQRLGLLLGEVLQLLEQRVQLALLLA